MFRFKKKSEAKFSKSYSQCAEDLLIKYVFNLRGIEKPTYIDIGANDPFFLSNTALFYEIGCRGINIEANSELCKRFELHRPEDVNLNFGISSFESELDFYIMSDNTLSTFSKDEYAQMVLLGQKLKKITKIKLYPITKILEKYNSGNFPDFMSIDVEGLDFQILQSINYEISSPKVICVEAAEYSPKGSGARRSELIDYLVSKGYYEYANTNLNAIMIKSSFWFV